MTEACHIKYNIQSSTGTFNTIAAGNRVYGNSLQLGPLGWAELESVTALVTCLAETNTLTITLFWQVSNDGSTWLDCATTSQNAASIAMATGTAGADTAVTKVFSAPQTIYGYVYARVALQVGGTTGTANDTYSIGYCGRVKA